MKNHISLAVLSGALFSMALSGSVWCKTVCAKESEAATILYDGPVFFGDENQFSPEETLERAGKSFRLISAKLEKAQREGRTKYEKTKVPYLLEAIEAVPETALVTVTDEDTGASYERSLPLVGSEVASEYWSEDFTFPITVQEYDAKNFLLGDTKIPGDADLTAYAAEFLDYLGLPASAYRIAAIAWDGDAYEEEGRVCRNARAKGEKRVREINAEYAGMVEIPQQQGYYYRCVYEEIEPAPAGREWEAMREAAVLQAQGEPAGLGSEEESLAERVRMWLMESLTVVRVSLWLILAAILLLVLAAVRRRGRRSGSGGAEYGGRKRASWTKTAGRKVR